METNEVEDEVDELEEPEERIFDPNAKYRPKELEEWADIMLKEDANRELCRKCKEKGAELPYGEETGEVESVAQYDGDGFPLEDEEGNQLYLDYPELVCSKGHRWFKGEGARRDIKGPNPILFESHIESRKRREIYVQDGTPDPSFTRDRFDRPSKGMYYRTHPQGRKVNTEAQRKASGASFYR